MSYSCAYFKNEDDTLYQAQVNKVDYILSKLYLKERYELIRYWLWLGLFYSSKLLKKYKVKGTGITLSREQYKEFKSRIQKEHLEDYLTVELMDYRDLPKWGKSFDRVVSVGMLEHVGRENYQLFNDCVNAVLKDKGLYLLSFHQSIKRNGN